MTFILRACLTAALLCEIGCAFGARHVDLTYGPTLPAAPSVPPKYGRVCVARFVDARSPSQGTGNLIAKVRNGYGMPTASVVSNQDPVLWVNEGVARTLATKGFTVERVQSAADSYDTPTVTGRVTRASGGMYASIDAEVTAQLGIEHRGTTVQVVSCSGSASKIAWTASSEEFRRVFEAAMAKFAETCGPTLTQILTGGDPVQ